MTMLVSSHVRSFFSEELALLIEIIDMVLEDVTEL